MRISRANTAVCVSSWRVEVTLVFPWLLTHQLTSVQTDSLLTSSQPYTKNPLPSLLAKGHTLLHPSVLAAHFFAGDFWKLSGKKACTCALFSLRCCVYRDGVCVEGSMGTGACVTPLAEQHPLLEGGGGRGCHQ